jgi:hypothetical protein
MNVDKLRVRKISKQEKYKIYNTETKEIVDIYDSRLLAHKALEKLKKTTAKAVVEGDIVPSSTKKVNFNDDVVLVHIKDGKNIKKQIKKQIKK